MSQKIMNSWNVVNPPRTKTISGLFDIFSSSGQSVGKSLLNAYVDEALKFSEFPHADYDAFITWANARVPDYETLIGDLVAANYASTSVDQAMDRLISLANQSHGAASISQIVAVAGGRGDTVNWAAGIPEISEGVARDAIAQATEIAQGVGQGVLSTAKLMKYLPWILGAAGAVYIFTIAGGPMNFLKKRNPNDRDLKRVRLSNLKNSLRHLGGAEKQNVQHQIQSLQGILFSPISKQALPNFSSKK